MRLKTRQITEGDAESSRARQLVLETNWLEIMMIIEDHHHKEDRVNTEMTQETDRHRVILESKLLVKKFIVEAWIDHRLIEAAMAHQCSIECLLLRSDD